jgi:hypothetical protein
VIDAVQSALGEALKIPEGDRTRRLIEHPPSHFAVPPGRGEKFTLVEVTIFSGRSMRAKRTLYQEALVRDLAALDVPPSDIKITSKPRRKIGASAAECRLPRSTSASRSTCSNRRGLHGKHCNGPAQSAAR